MSKSLRMLLLSILVVAVAAMPSIAATTTPKKFEWTRGAGNNWWGEANNWSADVSYVSSDQASYNVKANSYFPGKVSADVDVYISKDANIVLDATTSTGALSRIKMIKILGGAKVSLDIGQYGYFAKMPSIDVTSGELKLTGSVAREISTSPTWQGKGALTLSLPVTFKNSRLTLSVDNAALTINDATLLRATNVIVSGSKGKLVLNVSPETSPSNAAATNTERRTLSIVLKKNAVLETPGDVTIDTNRTRYKGAVISGDALIKTGAGTLTLTRAADVSGTASYDVGISSTVAQIAVNDGALVLSGTGVVTAVSADHLSIDVAAGKTLTVGARAVNTKAPVQLTIKGNATIAAAGIGSASSVYNSAGLLSLDRFSVSADVWEDGTLTFSGTQPVKELKGAGTVVVSGTNSVLIIDGTSKDVVNFTGSLSATNVGIAKSFAGMPFEKAASLDMAAVHVYGGATLSLDVANLPDGMDATEIYLRSNYNIVTEDALNASTVGDLAISGDITLGTLRVDGSKNGVAGVILPESNDKLTVNSLILHANKTLDESPATYSAVDAILISGDGGVFTPKAISNATSDGGLGSNRSVTVQGATLKLDVNLPEYNSLLLDGGTLQAANGVIIPGDLTIQATSLDKNILKVTVTEDNVRLYTGGHNAINVGANLVLNGNMSFDVTLDDDNQSIGRKYRIIGPRGTEFSKVTSDDTVSMDVTGTIKGSMHIDYDGFGIYGILDALALQPKLLGSEWTVSKVRDIEFEARISYDIPSGVSPASMINFVGVSVDIAGTTFSNAGTKRQIVKDNDKDLVYISSLKVNSPDKEIVMVGTLYADALETKVTLGWIKEPLSRDWKKYETAGITYNGIDVDSRDFKAGDTITLPKFSNPKEESSDVPAEPGTLSQDVTADPEEIVIEAETPEITAGSGNVVLSIKGIREAVVPNNSAPVLVGNTYVWNNGFDNTTKYEMLFNGNWILMESLDIRIDGVSVNSASVDIEGGSDSITVTIPAALFNTTTTVPIFQDVTIVGTNNGHTLTTAPASVHIVPDYEERPVDEGMGDVRYTTKDLPKSPIIVDGILDLTGPFSFDMTVNGSTETPSWFTWNVNSADGTIAYEVAEGAEAGTYEMRVIAYTAEGGYKYNFKLTITEGFKINNPDEPYGTIGGLNYEGRFTAENVPAGAVVEWDFPTNIAWLKSAPSGDVFVVYGHLPGHVDDEEAENDPNEYTYRVMATVSGDTVSKDWTITIEEDTDAEATIEYSDFTAGEITPSGDIESANSSYSVAIAFVEEYYDTEIEFLSLPYWLKATPVMGTNDDGDEVITGYTITYKEGTAVTAGETGVVRFDDPNEDGIVNWNVMFNETVQPEPGPGPAPQSADLKLTTASSVTLTLGTAAGATSTLALEAENALGTVGYTSTVSPDNGGLRVSISGSRATLTGSTAGTYTVVFTATDDGRAAPNNTATFTTTVTVVGGVLPPITSRDLTLGVSASSVSMNLGTQGGNTRTVTLTTTNASGDVTYTSAVTPASGLTVAISGDVATLTATTAGTYTVTFTATDAAGRTATAATTVTVTSGVTPPTPGGSEDVGQFSVRASRSVVTVEPGDVETFTLSTTNALGTVTYSSNQVWATVSGNTVTITAPETEGSYSVTITATDSGRSTDSNTATATVTVIVAYDDTVASVGSSGGGCDAGFGAMALALALPLFLRRRRS